MDSDIIEGAFGWPDGSIIIITKIINYKIIFNYLGKYKGQWNQKLNKVKFIIN